MSEEEIKQFNIINELNKSDMERIDKINNNYKIFCCETRFLCDMILKLLESEEK